MIGKIVRYFSYKLFTPGPLSTTATVKEAMMQDIGYSKEFSRTVEEINSNIIFL